MVSFVLNASTSPLELLMSETRIIVERAFLIFAFDHGALFRENGMLEHVSFASIFWIPLRAIVKKFLHRMLVPGIARKNTHMLAELSFRKCASFFVRMHYRTQPTRPATTRHDPPANSAAAAQGSTELVVLVR
jgi:hypothetical protein